MESLKVDARILGLEPALVRGIDIGPDDTIFQLGSAISKATGGKFEASEYKLVYNGKTLQPKAKVSATALAKGGVVFALPKFAETTGSILDLVFVVDCTGSMSSYIKNIQANIISIANQLVSLESANIHFGLVTYRDVNDVDNLVTFGFDPDVNKMKQAVDKMKHMGGADAPEMLASGMDAAAKLKYRPEATKICVLITDAPPHGIELSGDDYRNGDPNCRDLLEIIRDLATQGVILFSVGCEPSISQYPRSQCFMKWAANTCRGHYISLLKAEVLASVVLSGCREEINKDRLWKAIEEEIDEMRETGTLPDSETDVIEEITRRFTSRKKQIFLMDYENIEPEFTGLEYFDKLETLAQVKTETDFTAKKNPKIGVANSSAAICTSYFVTRKHIKDVIQSRRDLDKRRQDAGEKPLAPSCLVM